MPCCLSIVISLLSSIRSLLSELSLFGFPLLRKSKGHTLDSRPGEGGGGTLGISGWG